MGSVPYGGRDVVARHAFADGSQLDLYGDLQKSVDAVGRFAGAVEARAGPDRRAPGDVDVGVHTRNDLSG